MKRPIPFGIISFITTACTIAMAFFAASCAPAVIHSSPPPAATITIQDLRCDDQISPIDIDTPHPTLSWKLHSNLRGQPQTAYQLLIASTPRLLAADSADIWDSGRVISPDTIQIEYAGKILASRQTCFWKVRIWDMNDHASAWSPAATWSMALLSPADWHAHWITQGQEPVTSPMPIFRRHFTIAKPVRRAVIYISGLGQFDLSINGLPAGLDLLQPGWTDYRKTVLYVAHDVTSLLKSGDNAIGVYLGNGMYNVPPTRYHKFVSNFGPLKLIAQLHLDYTDGTSEVVATDSSWKVTSGPITFSSIYGGEDYDARLAPAGWDRPGFDDSNWTPAKLCDGPGGALFSSSHSAAPIRVAKLLDAIAVNHPRPGVSVYDMGQNCAQMPRILVAGAAGTHVRITPGELLSADGTVNQSPSGKGCYYQYTLDSSGPQSWSPRFCYYGSRYMQVETDATVIELKGQFITSAGDAIGDFTTSNDLFNRTNQLIRWAIGSNTMSILTDCPHREKLGWLEQDYLMGQSLMYNYDLHLLLRKICDDMSDAQLPSGLIPDIAPEYTILPGGFRDSPEWGSAALLIPWNLYQWYGDPTALRDHYDMMRRYVAYLASRASSGIVSHGLGDWYDLGKKPPGVAQLTPIALTATAFYYHDLRILSQSARLLGHADDAAAYAALAATVRDEFNSKFYDAANHRYAAGSQTADALALTLGLVEPANAQAVLNDLVQDVRRHNNGLTAGDVGYRYVLRALADAGRSDVIFDMNSRSDRPGYGWQLAHGATSLTEAWDAAPRSSQDHFMLGHIMEWFYSDLAGIQNGENSIAFQHIRIKPAIVGDVTAAAGSFDSVRGKIECNWRRDGDRITLDVTIPPGCDAMVWMPFGSAAKQTAGEKFVRMDGSAAVFAVESGNYSFVSTVK